MSSGIALKRAIILPLMCLGTISDCSDVSGGPRMAERVGLKRAVLYASLSVPFNQLFFTYAKDISELITWRK